MYLIQKGVQIQNRNFKIKRGKCETEEVDEIFGRGCENSDQRINLRPKSFQPELVPIVGFCRPAGI